MTVVWIIVGVAVVLAAAACAFWLVLRKAPERVLPATISNLSDETSVDAETGAVRSVQRAEVLIERDALEEIWTPMHLERLARTYWRFLTRVTLGLIRVKYSERGRAVVLLTEPLRLLTFEPPEYEMDATRGLVRWRIRRGLLVARRGRDGAGYLQIEVRRLPAGEPGARTDRRRGGCRQLLPGDRLGDQPAPLQRDAVADPRHRHLQLPALPGAAGPRRIAGGAFPRGSRLGGSAGPIASVPPGSLTTGSCGSRPTVAISLARPR